MYEKYVCLKNKYTITITFIYSGSMKKEEMVLLYKYSRLRGIEIYLFRHLKKFYVEDFTFVVLNYYSIGFKWGHQPTALWT